MSDRPITTREKCDCVRRELALRHRVYPEMVAQKLMRRVTADYEIAVMTAIVNDYCGLARQEGERLL